MACEHSPTEPLPSLATHVDNSKVDKVVLLILILLEWLGLEYLTTHGRLLLLRRRLLPLRRYDYRMTNT